MCATKRIHCPPQNQERKHRTYVYVLIVTELLEDWEDSVNIGKVQHLFTSTNGDHVDKVLRQSHGVRSVLSLVFLSGLNQITVGGLYLVWGGGGS